MPTRTIFFTHSPASQAVFYLLALVSVALCLYGLYRRIPLWRQGKKIPTIKDVPARVASLLAQVFTHQRIRRRTYAGTLHLLLFMGMLVLFIGTNIVAVEHYGALVFGDHWLYKGTFYLTCKLLLDLAGLALAIATGLALLRRNTRHSKNLGHSRWDNAFLVLLFVGTVTGFWLEGAGIALDPRRAPFARFSPVGGAFSLAMQTITPVGYATIWWIHTVLVLGVIAALPYGRWLHLFVAPISIVLQPERPMGALEPISLASVEETGRIGLGTIAELDRWQLLSLDACMECGRCTDVCPANAVGKELNPKHIVLDLRQLMQTKPSEAQTQSTDAISDEALWACTNCHACVRECPSLIRHVDIIDGIRRYRVAEGRLSGTAAKMLRQLSSRSNPWGLPASQRLDWAKGLNVPLAKPDEEREVLLWVGCAGAFDTKGQSTVRAFAQLLEQAGVKYAVLGQKEKCTGDPARRTGDEFLFQQLAEANVGELNRVQAKQIVTSCPHCFNTLKNEYPQFDGNYEVLHHTQYLNRLLEEGRLKLPQDYQDSVTYHDPCFLARVNAETEAPRALLNASTTTPILEVARRESKTFCCGAGGGRMWMEEPPEQRPGKNRAEELVATGAKTVAVGCPFCKIMVSDSVAQVAKENPPVVKDVAEVMLAAISAQSAKSLEGDDTNGT